MSVHITNVSNGLVSVELNSGRTVHLAPGERSGELEPYEVDDNHWVRVLRDRGRLAVESAGRDRRRAKNGAASGTPDESAPAN